MREGTEWRHGVLLFALLLSSLQGVVAEPCNKFASVASDQKVAVTVAGKCYYGFKQSQQWNDAVARCEGEGTNLVHLQTKDKQFAVYAALGSEFNQHWTGLRYLEGSWRWYYNSSYVVTATDDVTARWQGAANGESAYTTTSNMATLTAVQLDAWYKAVCEESGFGAEPLAETSTAPLVEQASPSLTQASTSLASETAPLSETSTASTSSATSNGVQPMTNMASAGVVAEPCNKFASVASDQKVAVTVAGKCYYGFKQSQQWNDAVARCEGEGTNLVHLQTKDKQFAVYAALGSEFNQHWTGLRYLEGSWRWYYNSSYVVTATDDVTARWQGAANGESAYTTTSNMATLTAVQLDAWYKAVCEESGFGAEPLAETSSAPLVEQASPSLTQASTSLASETAPLSETSTASTSSATSNGVQPMTNMASAGAEKFGYFHKQTTLSTAQFLNQFHNVTGLSCADRCLRTSGCRHFQFMSATKVCRVYEEHSSPSRPFPTCGAEGRCYTKIY